MMMSTNIHIQGGHTNVLQLVLFCFVFCCEIIKFIVEYAVINAGIYVLTLIMKCYTK